MQFQNQTLKCTIYDSAFTSRFAYRTSSIQIESAALPCNSCQSLTVIQLVAGWTGCAINERSRLQAAGKDRF
jgi:hypothetical protein